MMMLSALFPSHKLTDSLDRSRYDSFCRQCVNLHYPQYGDGHFILACYAAFPAVMSPDLLNRLWLNFGAYQQYGHETRIHPVAVSDVLLSSLFNETGFESYEMPKTLRLFFLECWQNLPPQYKTEFDLHEPAEIAEFLTQYIANEQDKLDVLTWEKQHYMALSYLNPQRLTYELAQEMKRATIPRDKLRYARTIRDFQENYKVFLAKEQQKIPYDFDKLSQAAAAQINVLFNKTSEAETIYNKMAQTGKVEATAKTHMVTIEVEEEIAVRIKVEKPKEKETLRKQQTGRRLYAVLIGIDDYTGRIKRLEGCVADADALGKFLEDFCDANGMHYLPLKIYNQAATRGGIIRSFEHFHAAKDNDACFLYFAGHGNRVQAPLEMSKDGNAVISSIVCCENEVTQIYSPEISYLIFKAAQINHQAHFLSMIDSKDCENLTNGKLFTNEQNSATRGIAWLSPVEAKDFLGYSEWKDNRPPVAKHIHLAASLDCESPRVINVNGEQRGAFSYIILEVLRETEGNINYYELIERTRFKIMKTVANALQTPLLNYYGFSGEEMTTLGFLGDKGNAKPSFLVGFDTNTNAWIVMGGGIQGISEDAVFELEEGQVIGLDKVFANYSKLKEFELEDKEKQLRAVLKQSDAGRSVYFAWQKDAETDDKAEEHQRGAAILKKTFETGHWEGIELIEDESKADYRIKVSDGSFQLLKIGEDAPVFKRVKRFEEASTHQFWDNCRAVARWVRTLEIDNPTTAINTDALEIVFYDSNGEPVRDTTYYQTEVGKPAIMQVCITNRNSRALWISAVYFGSDFMISNEFARYGKLNPGETGWLEYEGSRYIHLWVQPEYLSQGITRLRENLKIFVSTDFINTDIHNQNGLPLDGEGNDARQTASYGQSSTPFPNQSKTRAIRRVSAAPNIDWRTYDCPFTIVFSPEETAESTPSVSEQKTSSYDSPKKAKSKTPNSPIKKQIKKK